MSKIVKAGILQQFKRWLTDVVAPSVSTNTATNITETSADVSMEVLSNGGGNITQRGIVWGTSPNPTTSDNTEISSSNETGVYSTTLTGLTSGTTYYYRGFATNSAGTTYGADAWVETATVSSNTLTNGLVAIWEMDETSGTTLVDEKGNHNGTMTSVNVNQTGKINKAHSYSSASTSLTEIPYSSDLTPNNFSLSTWIYPDEASSEGIIRSAGGSGYSSGWQLFKGTNILEFRSGDGSAHNGNLDLGSYSPDNWYHIIITYDGSYIRVYINNSLVVTSSSISIGYVNDNTMQFGLGNGLSYFDGDFDQTALWDRVLTSTERDDLNNSNNGIAYSEWGDISTPGDTGGGGEIEEEEPVTTEWFVEPEDPSSGTYYVSSSTGDDSNPGTEAEPWETLSKVSSTSLSAGDVVLLKRGDTWLESLTINGSGNSTNDIIIGAYGSGNKPRIIGSDIATGWTHHSGNIYKTTITDTVTQVFADGERMRPARYPNTGYAMVTSYSSDSEFTSTEISTSLNYDNAKIFIRSHYYITDLLTVDPSSSGQTIVLETPVRGYMGTPRGFFFMDKYEFLDTAEEWYYNDSTNELFVWMPNDDSPDNYEVRVSVRDNGIYMNGNDYIEIRNLQFEQQRNNGILLDNTTNYITITGCVCEDMEAHGIISESGTLNMNITKNIISGMNGVGIKTRSDNATISDNLVSNIGKDLADIGLQGTIEDNMAVGIRNVGKDSTISWNRIENTGYSGIQFYRDNVIVEYNYIRKANELRTDNGAIYTSWYGQNTSDGNIGPYQSEVRNNIIVDSDGMKYGFSSTRSFVHGVYIDESAEGAIVKDNVIINMADGGIKLHQNNTALLTGNLIFNCSNGIKERTSSDNPGDPNEVNNNTIIINATESRDEYYDYPTMYLVSGLSTKNSNIDYNSYYNPYYANGRFSDSEGDYVTFSQWKSLTGDDANSTFDSSTLDAGEEQIIKYNDTRTEKTYTVTGDNVRDIDGNPVSSFTLQAFKAIVLRGSNISIT